MKPRCNLADSIVFVTRRCTQRQFLLRPDGTLNNNFLYCLLHAAKAYNIGLLALTVESNHYHVVGHDPDGQISGFLERLDGLAARSINCLRGRWEHFWASEAPCIVRCETRADVVDKVVYTLCACACDAMSRGSPLTCPQWTCSQGFAGGTPCCFKILSLTPVPVWLCVCDATSRGSPLTRPRSTCRQGFAGGTPCCFKVLDLTPVPVWF